MSQACPGTSWYSPPWLIMQTFEASSHLRRPGIQDEEELLTGDGKHGWAKHPFYWTKCKDRAYLSNLRDRCQNQALPCSEVSISPSRKVLPAEQEVVDLCK